MENKHDEHDPKQHVGIIVPIVLEESKFSHGGGSNDICAKECT